MFLAAVLSVSMLTPASAIPTPTGAIEGDVVDAVSTDGIAGVEACAIDPVEFEFVACELTGPSGEYLLDNLADGSYVVEFWARPLGYVTQYFDGKTLFSEADEVVVSGGATVPNVDAEMQEGGKIEGTVTDVATSAGIEKVEVCAYAETAFGGCAFTDPSGDYTIHGVATGSYLVEFWAGFAGYETRLYEEASNEADADLVSVVAPNATPGIDARLSKRPGPAGSTASPSAPPVFAPTLHKPRSRHHCRKGFKRVKRHGHRVCVRKHKKKHHGQHG